jgi:hypothetical protein
MHLPATVGRAWSLCRHHGAVRVALLVVAAVSLVGHLGLHANEHGPIIKSVLPDGPTLGVVASVPGSQSQPAIDGAGEHRSGSQPPGSDRDSDGPCGYLLPEHGGDGPAAYPLDRVDIVPATMSAPIPRVGRCPVGERAPPDLVYTLQVIRI